MKNYGTTGFQSTPSYLKLKDIHTHCYCARYSLGMPYHVLYFKRAGTELKLNKI